MNGFKIKKKKGFKDFLRFQFTFAFELVHLLQKGARFIISKVNFLE
jgi:hypothetical protein